MTQALQPKPLPVPSLKGSSNQDVRNKFFSMIGIESKLPPKPSAGPSESDAASTEWVNPRARKVVLSEEGLKYNKDDDELYAPKRRKTEGESSPGSRRRKRLGFCETVKVVPIPMRHEYSNRVRTRLWSNAVEIHENAARNSIEFAAEGWEWRTVTEDERMYVCVATGELIHPCHYEDDFKPDVPKAASEATTPPPPPPPVAGQSQAQTQT